MGAEALSTQSGSREAVTCGVVPLVAPIPASSTDARRPPWRPHRLDRRPASIDAPRLSSLAHGGGCGCTSDPAIPRQMLAARLTAGPFESLLVGTKTADDAAVLEREDGTCLIATTNAVLDLYAMGGRPMLEADTLPRLLRAALAREGFVTGASHRN